MKNLITILGLLYILITFTGCGVNDSSSENWNTISDIVVSDLNYSVQLEEVQGDSLKIEILNLSSVENGTFTLDWRTNKSRYVKKDNIKNLPYTYIRSTTSNSVNDIVFNTSEEGTFRIILSSK